MIEVQENTFAPCFNRFYATGLLTQASFKINIRALLLKSITELIILSDSPYIQINLLSYTVNEAFSVKSEF